MRDEYRQRIGAWLAIFPEVEWDRMTGDERWCNVFGWIARDDGRSDFLVLTLSMVASRHESVAFVTSSARYSREFAERIYATADDHRDCVRVADALGEFAP